MPRTKRMFEFEMFGTTYCASIGDTITDGEDVCKVKRYRDRGYVRELVVEINGKEFVLANGKRTPTGTKEDYHFKIVEDIL